MERKTILKQIKRMICYEINNRNECKKQEKMKHMAVIFILLVDLLFVAF